MTRRTAAIAQEAATLTRWADALDAEAAQAARPDAIRIARAADNHRARSRYLRRQAAALDAQERAAATGDRLPPHGALMPREVQA